MWYNRQSRTDQCPISVRYVNTEGIPEERFISLQILKGAGAEDYFNLLTNKLKELDLDIANCRGHSCDRASNMSGKLTGLQARVKELVGEIAVSVHCSCFKPNFLRYCDVNIQ